MGIVKPAFTSFLLSAWLLLGAPSASTTCPLQFSNDTRTDRQSRNQVVSRDGTRWQLVGMGEMEATNGTPLSFIAYRSADGKKVTITHGKFPSAESLTAEVEAKKKDLKV